MNDDVVFFYMLKNLSTQIQFHLKKKIE